MLTAGYALPRLEEEALVVELADHRRRRQHKDHRGDKKKVFFFRKSVNNQCEGHSGIKN